MKRSFIPIVCLIIFFTFPLQAENVRGPVVSINTIKSGEESAQSFQLKVGELGVIQLSDDHRFLQGFEIELRIPQTIREMSGNFAIYLYNEASGQAKYEVVDFDAKRKLFEVIGGKSRYFIQGAILADHSIKASADTFFIDEVMRADQFPLILTILPIMKGIPDAAANAFITVKLRPININKGALKLQLVDKSGSAIDPSENKIKMYLDGAYEAFTDEELVLTEGLHKIALKSELYRDETVTFGIERGKITKLRVPLTELTTKLTINAPRDVAVFLDGNRITDFYNTSLDIKPGEHTLIFRIGDYSVSKQFVVVPKKDYNISLFLDILIDEE